MPAVDGAFPTIRAGMRSITTRLAASAEAVMIISRLWALMNASISDIVVLLLVGFVFAAFHYYQRDDQG